MFASPAALRRVCRSITGHWRSLEPIRAESLRRKGAVAGCRTPLRSPGGAQLGVSQGSGLSRTAGASQHPRDPLDTFLEIFKRARVRKAHVALRAVRAEVEPRRNGNASFLQHPQCELGAVLGEALASGVDVKGPLGHYGDAKSQLAERGNHEIATAAELLPALLQHRKRFRPKRRERRVLRGGGGTNECVLGELFDLPHVGLGSDDPAQPPARHVEILGKAVDDENVIVQLEHGRRLTVVDQSLIDLVYHYEATHPSYRSDDRPQLVARDRGAGRI